VRALAIALSSAAPAVVVMLRLLDFLIDPRESAIRQSFDSR
jgi:hypothetical protein